MKKQKLHLLILLFVGLFCLTSCQSREDKVIHKIEKLTLEIEEKGSSFNEKDWERVFKEIENIHLAMEHCDFTSEQLKELGRAEGKLSGTIAQYGVKAMVDALPGIIESFGSYANEFQEGMSESMMDEECFQDLEEQLNDAFQSIEEELNDAFQETEEQLNDAFQSIEEELSE